MRSSTNPWRKDGLHQDLCVQVHEEESSRRSRSEGNCFSKHPISCCWWTIALSASFAPESLRAQTSRFLRCSKDAPAAAEALVASVFSPWWSPLLVPWTLKRVPFHDLGWMGSQLHVPRSCSWLVIPVLDSPFDILRIGAPIWGSSRWLTLSPGRVAWWISHPETATLHAAGFSAGGWSNPVENYSESGSE